MKMEVMCSSKSRLFPNYTALQPGRGKKRDFGTYITDNDKGGLLLCLGLGLGSKGVWGCGDGPPELSLSQHYIYLDNAESWFLSAEPLVQSRVVSCEIRGDRSGTFHAHLSAPPEVCDDPDQPAHYHILGHWACTWMVTQYSQVCRAYNKNMFEKRVATSTSMWVQFR
jgi:hypothetical protein